MFNLISPKEKILFLSIKQYFFVIILIFNEIYEHKFRKNLGANAIQSVVILAFLNGTPPFLGILFVF